MCRLKWGLAVLLLSGASLGHGMDAKVEGKVGYFRPSSEALRDIYPNRIIYGAEATVEGIYPVYVWANVYYYHGSGSSRGSCRFDTKMDYIPIGLGLKFLYQFNYIEPYLGGGVLFGYVHTSDHSPFVVQKHSKWGIGGVLKGGIFVSVGPYLFFDAFVDYNILTIHFHNTYNGTIVRSPADLTGFILGLGAGFQF